MIEDFARSIQSWTDCEITAYQLGIHMGAFEQTDVSIEEFYDVDPDNEELANLKWTLLDVLTCFEREKFIMYYCGESMYRWSNKSFPLD